MCRKHVMAILLILLAFVEGNIRQLIAGLIRFEWERKQKERSVDLSGFHDPEWTEE